MSCFGVGVLVFRDISNLTGVGLGITSKLAPGRNGLLVKMTLLRVIPLMERVFVLLTRTSWHHFRMTGLDSFTILREEDC